MLFWNRGASPIRAPSAIPWLRHLGEGLLDLFFPPLCVVCRAPTVRFLCEECVAAMPRLPSAVCHRCGAILESDTNSTQESLAGQRTCQRCRDSPPAFSFCRAFGLYQGALRDAIVALKYHRLTVVAPALATLLLQVIEQEPILQQAQVVVPVPLHAKRERWRGFNQSALLAQALATLTGLEVRCNVLAKVRHTRPQVGLNAQERRENLHGAFQVVAADLPRVPILLVDDVTTTGATLHECARALWQAGATDVRALVLARD